jgi:phenylacetic acid degradation operon negative regulatory protein
MSDRLTQATNTLVEKFQRQRPVRSGSLLITLFGDSIAPRGGAVTLGSLIRLAESFGIPERGVRTSVGRLAQEGWLAFRRTGRQSEYFLTEHGRSRFAEATQRIYGEAPQSWDGHWTLLLVPPGPRARRERVREEMAWLGFGQVSAGVLAHPSRSVADTRSQLGELKIDGRAVVMRAASDGPDADQVLLQAGWDLAELARAYQRFVTAFEPVKSALAGRSSSAAPAKTIAGRSSGTAPGKTIAGRSSSTAPAKTIAGRSSSTAPETAFVIRTLLIHEYRKIHLRDPLLPYSLLPEDWIGARAYELCRDLYRRVFSDAEAHVAAVASTLDGKLSAPLRETYKRFGGLLTE